MWVYNTILEKSEIKNTKNQSHLEDRKWLEKLYLPQLCGKTLFVGVSYYTDFYYQLIQTPKLFKTVDPDRNMSCFGSPYGHFVGTVEQLFDYDSTDMYKNICLYGLFGMEHSLVKESSKIINILNLAYTHTENAGTIMFGTSTNTFTVNDAIQLVESSSLSQLSTKHELVIKPSSIHSLMYVYWGER